MQMKSIRVILNNMRLLCYVFVVFLLTGCGKVDLLSNLPEEEANNVMSIMQQSGISVSKKSGAEQTWTVVLNNADDFSKAVGVLNKGGFPNTPYATIGQIFQKSSLVSSPLEEKARFMYALSEDVAKSINLIPGVLRSRVHIVLPETDAYTDEQTEATAAVFVTYRADDSADVTKSYSAMKSLVANSIPGLKYENVSISAFPVSFEEKEVRGSIADTGFRNAMGVTISDDSIFKFWAIIIVMGCISVFSLAMAVFFFISSRMAKKSLMASIKQQQTPIVVQNDKKPVENELDEEGGSGAN